MCRVWRAGQGQVMTVALRTLGFILRLDEADVQIGIVEKITLVALRGMKRREDLLRSRKTSVKLLELPCEN